MTAPSQAEARAAPAEEGPGVVLNSVSTMAGRIVGYGFGFASNILTAHRLDAVGVGILAVTFGLVEFGRALSNFTHNPSILAYHRGTSAEKAFGTSLALKLAGSVLFTAVAALAAPALADVFHVPPVAIVLASLGLVLGSFYEVGAARLEADNRMLLSNAILSVGPAVGLGAVVAFILADNFTVTTSIVSTLLAVAAMSLGFVLAWRGPWRLAFDGGTARYLLGYGSRIVATTLLTQALIWTDTLMVSALRGNTEAGVYNVVFQITFVMVTASVSIGIALLPAMSRAAGRGEDTTVEYQRATLFALVLALGLALAFVVGGRVILGVYGSEFVDGYPALLVLTAFGVAGALVVPASTLLTVHGHASAITALSLAQALLNVVLNYVLITRYGYLGAAVATSSIFVLGTLGTWWLVRHYTGALPFDRRVAREAWGALRQRLAR